MSKNFFLILSLFILGLACISSFWKLDAIDLESSENIYVADSVAYIRGDPFIFPRQHLRKPHAPAAPHPFFVPLLTAEVMKMFGLSVFSARFLQASLIVLTTILIMFFSYVLFHSRKVTVMTGLIFTTFPLVVRYGRMAVLDPVLMLFQTLTLLWVWQMLKSKGYYQFIFASLVGVGLGICMSIKLTGIFTFLFIPLYLFLVFIRKKDKTIITLGIFIIFTTMIIFVLFNDPYSYMYGWIHFEGRRHGSISLSTTIKGLIAIEYWYPFLTKLVGIVPVVNVLLATYLYRKKILSNKKIFFGFWIGCTLIYLLLNPSYVTGLSSEWAYLPLMPPLAIIVSVVLVDLWNRFAPKRNVSILFAWYLLVVSPHTIFYGLRFRSLPLPNLTGRNVVLGDLAVTKIIQTLNQNQNRPLVLIYLKDVELPLWLLHANITTEPFYHPILSYAYIVTDNQKVLVKAERSGFFIRQQEKNPSESKIYLLENSNYLRILEEGVFTSESNMKKFKANPEESNNNAL